MPDDPVIEIGHVQRAVRADPHVDGAKPGVIASQKVGSFTQLGCRSIVGKKIAMDTVRYHVANQQRVLKLLWEIRTVCRFHAGDRR